MLHGQVILTIMQALIRKDAINKLLILTLSGTAILLYLICTFLKFYNMKRNIILFFAWILFFNCSLIFSQQTLEVSFKARHYEGEDVGLDSIRIKNINRNCDTMLFAPDTILELLFYVGLDEVKANTNLFTVSQNYPNPVTNGKTSVNIFMPIQDQLFIKVFDLQGYLVADYTNVLSRGLHSFDFVVGNPGTYLITAITNNQLQSVKVMSLGSRNQKSKIEYASYKEKAKPNLKTRQINNGFWYEPGDTLRYVGFAKTPYLIDGSDVIESVPLVDTLINFSIVEGLPCPGIEAVKFGGHLYPTVQIDEQCWLKENLNIGTMIHGDSTMHDNGIIEKYCYDNNPENCNEYGGLYQWWELMNYYEEEGSKGICPEGWHISTQDDLLSLVFAAMIGNTFKERGNSHWVLGYNGNGNNTRGFTAMGTGGRQIDKNFIMKGENAPFHSSTKMTYDWVFYLEFNFEAIVLSGTMRKDAGLAVRCIKN